MVSAWLKIAPRFLSSSCSSQGTCSSSPAAASSSRVGAVTCTTVEAFHNTFAVEYEIGSCTF